ncbi:MAG: hypothetical protein MJZ65_00520 [Paludibacteraceae bacterium]|nr:hypothetical protein [Paludibacteraceae bacterium]
MRKWLIYSLLFIVELAYGQFSDKQLYDAYMASDLKLWGQYIDAQDWKSLSHAERRRLINYEYGYIPFLADQKRMEEAAHYLPIYLQHVEEERSSLGESTYLAYRSAAHAYAYLLDKSTIFSDGMMSFKMAKKALEADTTDPIAMTLKGNVDFYAPKCFGGNKQKAIQIFLQAERIMTTDTAYRYLWNLPAMQLAIAQCYEKTGELDKAEQQVEKVLRRHPTFTYVRNTYLPELKKKKQKK